MIYADTDFFLALIKPRNWLNQRAKELHEEHRHELVTSVTTVTEMLLVGHRFSLDPELVVGSIFSLVPRVTGIDCDTASAAAHLIKEKGLNVFDAFHAAYCGGNTIVQIMFLTESD
ncbi:PIN domain-containing protein [Candidatus Woesearchaeota archaeon]|nr:PIN domain-containing protein [Candidatus Woesearchaeota archaeon]